MHTINPIKLKDELKDCIHAGYPAMIWGGPGIGKSDIPAQVAQELNIKLIDFRANLFDPVDVRGIPYIKQLKETGKRFQSLNETETVACCLSTSYQPHHQQRKMLFYNCCSTEQSVSTHCLLAGRSFVLATD